MKKRTKLLNLIVKPKFRLRFILFLLILVLIPLGLVWRHYGADENPGTKNYFTKRYFMASANLDKGTETDRLLALMDRAASIGYNGVVLTDRGGQYNSPRNETYQANAAEVVAKGQALGMAIIPQHFSSTDPYYDAADKSSIEEALPVQGTRYIVNSAVDGSGNHTTTFNGDNGVTILNDDLENWTGNTPDNFWTDGAGTVAFRESLPANVHGGSSSLRIDNPGNSANKSTRLVTSANLTVKPNTSYTFSVWIKTDSLTNPEKLSFQPYGQPGGQLLFMSYTSPFYAQGISSTQDYWKQYSIVFTTQNKTQLALYLGLWNSTATGSYWLDDLSLTENGMAGNLLNRASLNPLVKSEDSLTTYTQNQDYYLNGSTITVPPASPIHAGDFIRVDWYQEPLGRDREASACYDAYFNYLKADGLRLQSYFGNPKGYMSGIDEWRTANWDPACKALNGGNDMTGGEYIAYVMNKTYDTIKSIRADADVYVWNDMFDPYMNAVDNYCSVNGTAANSWLGLPTDVIVVNWDSVQTIDGQTGMTKMKSSMQFFANQSNHQILSMSMNGVNNYLNTLDQLEAASGGISGVDGFMYTSWDTDADGFAGNFDNLEAMANVIKAAGRWGTPSDVKTTTPTAVSIPSFTYKDKITIYGTKDASSTEIFVNGSSIGVVTDGNNWSKEVALSQGVNSVVNIVAKASGKESSDSVNLSITRRKPGDANGDGLVDKYDFSILMSEWSKQETDNIANFDEDNVVGMIDFGMMMSSWGG